MSNKNLFITGNTDLLILSILKTDDTYAYDIVKQITALSEGKLVLSNPTIYTAVYKLLNNGCISEYSRQVGKKRTRVYYHLEEKGAVYLDDLMKNYINTTQGTNRVLRKLYHKGEDKFRECDL